MNLPYLVLSEIFVCAYYKKLVSATIYKQLQTLQTKPKKKNPLTGNNEQLQK